MTNVIMSPMGEVRGGPSMKIVPGEFYAGHKASETPRMAFVDGRWVEDRARSWRGSRILRIRRRARSSDLFRCRLEDGRIVVVGSGSP